MAHRLEIGNRKGVRDVRGESVKERAASILGLRLGAVRTRTVYKIDAKLAPRELGAVRAAFQDGVMDVSAYGRLRAPAFDWLVEVGFKPGVTDNVGRTARVALGDILGRDLGPGEAVYTATQYFIRAPAADREAIMGLAVNLLANTLIQTVSLFSAGEWRAAEPDLGAPAVCAAGPAEVRTYDLNVPDGELMRISRDGILSCSLEEMRAIRDYFNSPGTREARAALDLPPLPTDVEVECLAQSWSEHCKHKIFAANVDYTDERGRRRMIRSLFASFIKAATEKLSGELDWMVSVFKDNAGIIRFNDRLNLVYKVETHNSPSALDPYGGAMTGIVGVNRDPMGTGMGASLLANVWGYCLASPFHDGEVPAGLMHPRRIRDGVHLGVIEGGNQSGVPWARGWEIFDERFLGKPLVFCGTVGVIPARIGGAPSEQKAAAPGDAIVMIGGRIGKDGIHGATFSSAELNEASPVQAVQIGDPITQRKMYEFLIEARDLGMFRSVTDIGAGGLSCSVGEMGASSGGADLDLALAPLKYEGLMPWEILLSEAQERMTLAVPQERVQGLLALARRRDVDAAVLGTFNDSGAFVIRHGRRVVGRLDMEFLHGRCPVMTIPATWAPGNIPGPELPRKGRRDRLLLRLLGSVNGCSREFKSRQYDAEVKGLSVLKPYVGALADMPSDASVMRVEYGRNEGVILAEGVNPFYSDLDPYHMVTSVADEAVRRVISVGGRLGHIAGLDNFCWPDPVLSDRNPDGPFKMGQLVRANEALYDVCIAYKVPCISGKDSCKNDSTRGGREISVPPTVLFSTIARMDDVRNAVTLGFKTPGDVIYVIGSTRPELGASLFYRMLAAEQGRPMDYGGEAPKVDFAGALALYHAMEQATGGAFLRSSHTPALGGLAAALAHSALGGRLGAEVDLSRAPAERVSSDDEILFSESNSRFVVSVAPNHCETVENLFSGLPFGRIGVVTGTCRLQIRGLDGRTAIDAPLDALSKAFKETLHGV
ncbi:MAG: phosphoribosylformylglycinamidine synthase [Lentisphaerae bacterium]|nr:phosphoribosylformylglycinamidine synthase [Lentisphaerota bacterium]